MTREQLYLFYLKAFVQCMVTVVWAIYIVTAILEHNIDTINLIWVGLPGATFFALFPQFKGRGSNNDK